MADKRLGDTEAITGSDGVATRWSSRARTLVDAVYGDVATTTRLATTLAAHGLRVQS